MLSKMNYGINNSENGLLVFCKAKRLEDLEKLVHRQSATGKNEGNSVHFNSPFVLHLKCPEEGV